IKYKKKIFGEILKFKITIYFILNILIVFVMIISIFLLIDFAPSIIKMYDYYNYLIEENYLTNIDKINIYIDNLQKIISESPDLIQKLITDPSTLYLKFNNKIFVSKVDKIILEEINEKIIDRVILIEKNQKPYLAYNNNNLSIIYTISEELVNSKNILFELITEYKKIYSQKKNSLIIIFLSLFLIILPILFFQIYFLFRYISNTIKPLESIVTQFKKVSLNIFSPIQVPRKRFDEFSFLIIQFNRMQKQLEQRTVLLKYQERFETLAKITSKFAHEIKNPLTPIILSCELIMKKYPHDDNFRSYLFSKIKLIQDNIEIIRNSISKFYTISGETNKEKVHILLNEQLLTIITFWNSDTIEIKLEIPEKPISIYAQKDEIESMFNNLIINSFEACKIDDNNRCKIFIKVYISDDQFFNIIYTDNGSGISDKDKDKIFEPYFTTKEKGSGFGLTIVKSIIENLNGKIEFIGNGYYDSKNYHGATFLIQLPISKPLY
ncbi:MAG: ATP-binding protein, partial [Exilispira sp.]